MFDFTLALYFAFPLHFTFSLHLTLAFHLVFSLLFFAIPVMWRIHGRFDIVVVPAAVTTV
jgi:hypothetical protein